MKRLICIGLLGACGASEVTEEVLVEASALETCLAEGGALGQIWAADNQHGPISSIDATSVIVVGGTDGSVKQWSFDGDAPVYGSPFATKGDEVGAVALTDDGHVVAATATGLVVEWRLADAAKTRSDAIPDGMVLQAIAVRPGGARVVTGGLALYVLDRPGTDAVRLVSNLWHTWGIEYPSEDRLYAAGHYYSTPRIERFDTTQPMDVIDVWEDQFRQQHVRAIDLDEAETMLAAAGDRFVAVLDPDDLAAGPLAITDQPDHMPVGVTVLPGGELFVTAGTEGSLRVWRTSTAELVTSLPIPPAAGLVRDPEGTRLFTAGPDGHVRAFGCR
jgi:WD40 repeat protein